MGFNLADVLGGVSNFDTGREQIEYIKLDLIDVDPNNFYQLSDIDNLAANIQLCGLQQPIRLRKHPTDEGRYMIVSGHRRREAILLLAKDDPDKWEEVPCIIEADEVPAALQQLRLIYANSNTRTMTSSELSEQAVQVEKLLYQLKEEGYEFPGRMRDHVAKAVNASKTKLARLKVIRDNLAKCWEKYYKKDIIKEASAYALAQLPPEWQRMIFDARVQKGGRPYIYESDIKNHRDNLNKIERLKCSIDGAPCANRERKKLQAVQSDYSWNVPCTKCCKDCSELSTCRNACPNLADEVQRIKADKREANRQAKVAKEEADRPYVERLKALWTRFASCRQLAGASVKTVYAAMDRYYRKGDDERVSKLESLKKKFTKDSETPFGYSCQLKGVKCLIALADLFNCSIDYMLCRTDVKEMAQPVPEVSECDTGWQAGDPAEIGEYVILLQFHRSGQIFPKVWSWNGSDWVFHGIVYDADVDGQILGWMKLPEVE